MPNGNPGWQENHLCEMRFKLSPPVSSALMHLYLGTYGAVRLNLDRQRLLNAGFLRNSSPSAELPLGLLAGSR